MRDIIREESMELDGNLLTNWIWKMRIMAGVTDGPEGLKLGILQVSPLLLDTLGILTV